MAKKRKKRATVTNTESSSQAEKSVVDISEVNLRTVGPVTRLRGIMAMVSERVESVEAKLSKWGDENAEALAISQAVTSVHTEIVSILEQLESLELSGFRPNGSRSRPRPRKVITFRCSKSTACTTKISWTVHS